MSSTLRSKRIFPSARESAASTAPHTASAQSELDSYRLAFQDGDFLLRDELRSVRLQLEAIKPELIQQEEGIESTIVIFGSARVPDPDTARIELDKAEAARRINGDDPALITRYRLARLRMEKSRYYDEARKLGRLISNNTAENKLVVVTGGGPGIMEAANRGAHDQGKKSIGMNVVLPHEQAPNPYISPQLCFQFHYFAIRKMHLLMRAKSLVAFPGGFGTMDELFETLTLIQTGKIKPMPVLLFGKSFWTSVINFQALVDAGTISTGDLNIFQFVETAEAAWKIISKALGVPAKIDRP